MGDNADGASPFRSISQKGYSDKTPLRYSMGDKVSGLSDSLDISQNAASPDEPSGSGDNHPKTFKSRIEKTNLLKVSEAGPQVIEKKPSIGSFKSKLRGLNDGTRLRSGTMSLGQITRPTNTLTLKQESQGLAAPTKLEKANSSKMNFKEKIAQK